MCHLPSEDRDSGISGPVCNSFSPPWRDRRGLAHFKGRDAEEQRVNEMARPQQAMPMEKGANPGLLESELGVVNPLNVLPGFMILV